MVILIAGSVSDFFRYLAHRHILEAFEALRFAEVRQQHFFFGSLEDERLVVALYLIIFVGLEPVAIAGVQQVLDLGVELWVVEFRSGSIFSVSSEEAAVAGWCVQHLRVVAGTGKRRPVG